MSTRIDAALILWNSDVIELVSMALKHSNIRSYGIEPAEGANEHLLESSNPAVVIFDLDPPYRRSAAVVRDLLHRFPAQAFVFTCADPVLAINAAPWLSSYTILQKPYDINEIVTTVRSLMTAGKSKLVEPVSEYC
jgi:DNA-binding NtrC family response regulator